MTTPTKILIFAGNMQEAFQFARENNIKRKNWSIVRGIDDVRGYYGATILCIGTYSRLNRSEEVIHYAESHGFGLFYYPELPLEHDFHKPLNITDTEHVYE